MGAGPPRPRPRASGERLAPESPGSVADPDGLSLDGFDDLDDNDRDNGSTPTAFVVTGFTSSQKAVARVIDRLSVLPWLSDVSLQQSTRADTGRGGKAVQFTIGANLSSTGGK